MVTEKASVASYLTGLGVGFLGLALNEWIAVGGFLLAGATFTVNWYYKARQDKRAERESQARIEAINNQK